MSDLIKGLVQLRESVKSLTLEERTLREEGRVPIVCLERPVCVGRNGGLLRVCWVGAI